jgi:hypothetical protein
MGTPFTHYKANFFIIKKKYSSERLLIILLLSTSTKTLDNTKVFAFLTTIHSPIAQEIRNSSYQTRIIELKERSLSLLRKRHTLKRWILMKIRIKASKL